METSLTNTEDNQNVIMKVEIVGDKNFKKKVT
jgi:hypothetical protein